MPTVDLRGVRSHHEVYGEGEPVVVLHGGFCSLENLRPLADAVAEDHRVHAVERPGHGRTPDREGPITYGDGVLDTLAYLDAVGLDSAHVVGFSDGGIIGLMLALEHPERLRSLVAISANLSPDGFATDEPMPDEPVPVAPPTSESGEVDAERAAYEALSPDGPEHADVVLAKLMTLWTTQPQIDPARLASIATPVLVLAGDGDVVTTEHTVSIARAIPGAQLAIVPGAGHLVASERPDLTARLVRDFLASHPTT